MRYVFFLFAIFAAHSAAAHHSLAAYDTSFYRTVEGIIVSIAWTNPHTGLVLRVETSPGAFVDWTFEGGSTGRLSRDGFTTEAIAPGDAVTVSYHPDRNGAEGGFFLAVTKSDGTTYALPRFYQIPEEPQSGRE